MQWTVVMNVGIMISFCLMKILKKWELSGEQMANSWGGGESAEKLQLEQPTLKSSGMACSITLRSVSVSCQHIYIKVCNTGPVLLLGTLLAICNESAQQLFLRETDGGATFRNCIIIFLFDGETESASGSLFSSTCGIHGTSHLKSSSWMSCAFYQRAAEKVADGWQGPHGGSFCVGYRWPTANT